jgi:hypothetical protein
MTEVPLGGHSHVTTGNPLISQGEAAAGHGLATPPTEVVDQSEASRPINPKMIVGKVEVGPATSVVDGGEAISSSSSPVNLTESNNSELNITARQPNKKAENLSMNITTYMNYKEKVAAFADALEVALNQVNNVVFTASN